MFKKFKIDFFSILLLILLMLVLFCYAQLKIFKKDYVNLLGYTTFNVISGSMEPTIKVNDIILVKLTKKVDFFDIITYKADDGNYVTHRVKKILPNGQLVTQGDSNNTEDKIINNDDVVGKVVFVLTASIWFNVLKSPEVIIVILITVIAFWYLFIHKNEFVKESKKDKE